MTKEQLITNLMVLSECFIDAQEAHKAADRWLLEFIDISKVTKAFEKLLNCTPKESEGEMTKIEEAKIALQGLADSILAILNQLRQKAIDVKQVSSDLPDCKELVGCPLTEKECEACSSQICPEKASAGSSGYSGKPEWIKTDQGKGIVELAAPYYPDETFPIKKLFCRRCGKCMTTESGLSLVAFEFSVTVEMRNNPDFTDAFISKQFGSYKPGTPYRFCFECIVDSLLNKVTMITASKNHDPECTCYRCQP